MQRQAVKSAMRTFEVLELFAERRQPLSLHEVYTALSYPQSSATNLLKSMVMLGYLNYNRRTRTYVPTMRIKAFGNWLGSYIQSEGGFRELVEELQRRTDETVALLTQNDFFIQFLFLKAPDHSFKNSPRDGAMRTLVNSSGGRAIMSRMSDATIDKLVRYTNHYELGIGGSVSLDEVMADILSIRRVGYCYRQSRSALDTSSISIALDADLHGIPLAIGVCGLPERIAGNKADIVATMRDLVAEFQDCHSASTGRRDDDDGSLLLAAE